MYGCDVLSVSLAVGGLCELVLDLGTGLPLLQGRLNLLLNVEHRLGLAHKFNARWDGSRLTAVAISATIACGICGPYFPRTNLSEYLVPKFWRPLKR